MKQSELRKILNEAESIDKRIDIIEGEDKNINFNYFSIIVIGFLLGLFTNIWASFIYDDIKHIYYFKYIAIVSTIGTLLWITNQFNKTFIKPRIEEYLKLRKIIKDYKILLKKEMNL